jgi:hypothetical protein
MASSASFNESPTACASVGAIADAKKSARSAGASARSGFIG